MKKQEKTIILRMTADQLRCIAEGMEFYSRFIAGQFNAMPPVLVAQLQNQPPIPHQILTELDRCLEVAKQVYFPMLSNGQHFGLGQGTDTTKKEIALSYAIYREILHAENKGKQNTYSSPTLNYTNQPLIDIVKP